MKITFLGACQQVGKSCVLAQLNESRVLLDAGLKINSGTEAPDLHQYKFDACVITHAHLDHAGFAAGVTKYGDAAVFATFPTIPLTKLLLEDAEKIALQDKKSIPFSKQDLKKLDKKFFGQPYEHEYAFYDDTRMRLLNAGHILGSAQVLLEYKRKRLVYTGDFNYANTRTHDKATPPKEEINTLIMESTYAHSDHPNRKKNEKDFCSAVQKAVNEGQTVLMPSFAVGRTQELIQILYANKVKSEIYVDGMGLKVNAIALDFPSYLHDAKMFEEALDKTKTLDSRDAKRKALEKACIIIATAGMLDGGPALSYIQALNQRQRGVVFLTGFQVPGSNGAALMQGEKLRVNNGSRYEKIDLPVTQWDFSAHSGRAELFDYVKKVNPEHIYCLHGEKEVCLNFARELQELGFDAHAPEEGEKIEV